MKWDRTHQKSNAIGVAAVMLLLTAGSNAARAEPPIRSPEDAACRAEAKAKVFSTPNPKGLDIEQVGRGLYQVCMDRHSRRSKGAGGRRRR